MCGEGNQVLGMVSISVANFFFFLFFLGFAWLHATRYSGQADSDFCHRGCN